eukprot:gene13006-biopygen2660
MDEGSEYASEGQHRPSERATWKEEVTRATCVPPPLTGAACYPAISLRQAKRSAAMRGFLAASACGCSVALCDAIDRASVKHACVKHP